MDTPVSTEEIAARHHCSLYSRFANPQIDTISITQLNTNKNIFNINISSFIKDSKEN